MAKTYEEWEAEAKKSGYYDTFSKEDINQIKQDTSWGDTLLTGKKEYDAAATPEEKAAIADKYNSQRINRGYYNTVSGDGSGGYKADSHTMDSLGIIKAYDSSLPSDKSSKYMTMIDTLLTQIAGDKFSYDAKSDPRYALAEEYAQQAMDNQMAESAILSGGYGNSYAANVGQQVYTDYMDDAVNDMEDRAYDKWLNERENKYNLLGIAQGLEEQAYNRAWNEDEREYNRAWDEDERRYSREQTDKQWAYTENQDAEEKAEAAKAQAQDSAYAFIMTFGTTDGLSEEELAATGWSQSYITALCKQAQDNIASGNVPEFSASEALSYYVGGNKSTKVCEAMQYYFGDDYAENADAYYKNLLAQNTTTYYSGGSNVTPADDDGEVETEEEVKTEYTDARNYLSEKGVANVYLEELMSPAEFNETLKKYGSVVAYFGDSHPSYYKYDDYVDGFLNEYKNKESEDKTLLSEVEFERKKRNGSVTINGIPFDSYEDYLKYMDENV